MLLNNNLNARSQIGTTRQNCGVVYGKDNTDTISIKRAIKIIPFVKVSYKYCLSLQ